MAFLIGGPLARLDSRFTERLAQSLIDQGLRSLDHHRIYWDARGRGLLAGLEIVRDNGTGEDFTDRLAAGNALRVAARDRGLTTLLLHPGNVLFIAPAVVASEADIDRTIEAFAEAFVVYRRALDEGIDKYLCGRPVKPAIRSFA